MIEIDGVDYTQYLRLAEPFTSEILSDTSIKFKIVPSITITRNASGSFGKVKYKCVEEVSDNE